MTACVWQLRDGRGFYFCILTQKLERLELFSNYTLCNVELSLGLKSSFVMGMGYFGGFLGSFNFFFLKLFASKFSKSEH